MNKSSKPQGYYEEIQYTSSKAEDLIQFLENYEVDVLTNKDADCEYLDDNDLLLSVKNPYCDQTLDIELAGGFSVFFAGWHAHYFTYEYDYRVMKKDILGILDGSFCVMVANTQEGWLCSVLCSDDVLHVTDGIQILRKTIQNEEIVEKLISMGGCVQIIHWNPADTISFDIPSGSLIPTD